MGGMGWGLSTIVVALKKIAIFFPSEPDPSCHSLSLNLYTHTKSYNIEGKGCLLTI